MAETIFWLAYAVTGAAAWPVIYRRLYAWRMNDAPSVPWDKHDRQYCTAITTLVSIIWPASAVVWVLGRCLSSAAKSVEGRIR